MTLAELIARDALAAATAGNWTSVAATLNALTVPKTSAGTLTSMARTLASLADSEREPTLAAFATTQVGKSGLAKLAATGLDFAHPITIGLIETLRGTLPAGVADKLLRLGNWTVSPAADQGFDAVTSSQCESAWKTKKIGDRIVNAAALAKERIATTDTPEQQFAKLAQAWTEAV